MLGARVIVVGDVIDDVIVVPQTAIRPDTDTRASITRHPGGSAGNTAAWLGSLGASVDFVGCVGRGDAERHGDVLRGHGVVPHLREHPSLSTGAIVIIVDGDVRTMLTDRGANAGLDTAAITEGMLADAGVLHLSGYSLVDALTPTALVELSRRAHAHGVRVTFDPGSTGFIADLGVDVVRSALVGVDVLLPNRDEALMLSGESDVSRAVAALLELCPAVVMTGGSGAVLVGEREKPLVEVAVHARRAVDPTGAGDAFSAGFIAGLLRGLDLASAAAEGVEVAALAISRPGGRPHADVTPQRQRSR